MPKIVVKDEDIIKYAKESSSRREVLKKLGIFLENVNRNKFLNRKFTELNIDVSHFTGQLWSKGKTFLDDSRLKSNRPISEYFCSNSQISRSIIRNLLIKKKYIPYLCVCGCDGNWQGQKISLDLHHINGIRNDNRLENLSFLCPNCHATTDSYRGKRNLGIALYEDEVYIKTIQKSYNCRQVLLTLNHPESGASYNKIRQILKKYQIKFLDKPLKVKIPKKNKLTETIKSCEVCEKETRNKYCSWECLHQGQRKVPRPSKEELYRMIWEIPCTTIAKNLGVSDSCIGKWCKIYKIDKPPVGYWRKIEFVKNLNANK